MKNILKLIILILFTSFILTSCIIVKQAAEDETPPVVNLFPKPEVPMSEKVVRTKAGDVVAYLPKDWFFVDVENGASTDVFAYAVNPDYTLGVVFSNIRKNDQVDKIFDKEGLLGLARLDFERHLKKTSGGVKQVGKYQTMNFGTQSYARYEFLASDSLPPTMSMVFKSEPGNYYEVTLVPMNITGKPILLKPEIEKIFRSIAATIQY